jgi:serine/threonine-protein kinase
MMEYLAGETLADAIKAAGRFPLARALNIAAQIADALGASHAHGIIHRDLKPENIVLVVRDGVNDFVKVLDFGLAKLSHRGEKAPYKSAAGWVMGTPYYMSPEQCEGRAEIDHRTDIYALGVILFEMVTGSVPFAGDVPADILVHHVKTAPPAARSLVPDLPAAVDAILSRSLAKDPSRRFQTMAEFREALLDLEHPAALHEAPSLREQALALRGRSITPEGTREAALTPAALGDTELAPAVKLSPRPSPPRETRGPRSPQASIPDLALKPPHRRRAALLTAAAVAVALVAGVTYRHQAMRVLEGVAVGVPAYGRPPARIRLTFDSEPRGATVIRSDGRVVGVTPVVTEIAPDSARAEYTFEKQGFAPKTTSIVPQTSLSIFEALAPAIRVESAQLEAEVVPLPRLDPPNPPAPSARAAPAAFQRPASRRRPAPSTSTPARAAPPPLAEPAPAPPPPSPVRPLDHDRDDILAPSES